MPFPRIWRRVALVWTEVLEECTASVIRVERISELGTILVVTSNWSTLRRTTNSLFIFTVLMEVICSSEISVLTRLPLSHLIVTTMETSNLAHSSPSSWFHDKGYKFWNCSCTFGFPKSSSVSMTFCLPVLSHFRVCTFCINMCTAQFPLISQ
jgi:hypothetical protein